MPPTHCPPQRDSGTPSPRGSTADARGSDACKGSTPALRRGLPRCVHKGTVEEAADAIELYLPNRKRPKDLSGLSKNLRLHEDGRYRWHWDPKFIASKHGNDNGHAIETQQIMLKAAANLKLPVLLVRGQNSELVSQEHVQEFIELVPHAHFTDIKNAGHMVAGDRNDIFAEAVQSFLDKLFRNAAAS